MRFITEEDLRACYRQEHFTSYRLEPGTRLTPGARQYLSDLGIRMPEEEPKFKKQFFTNFTGEKKNNPGQNTQDQATDEKNVFDPSISNPTNENQGWRYMLQSIQAKFLETGIELLQKDVLLAQEIFELERFLAGIEKAQDESSDIALEREKPICRTCSGISPEHAGETLPDCFEVTGFHAQSPKGEIIVKLHILRCALRELSLSLPSDKIRTVNQVINRLSQMICQTFGGKICQKN